jgi:hypothetical protein
MIPSEIRANFDTDFTVPDKASEVPVGYEPKFILGGASSLKITGTVDGEDLAFSILASRTASFATGQYWYQVVAEQTPESSSSSGDVLGRKFIADGMVWVVGKITGEGVYDGKTVAEHILAAIDATIRGKATADQKNYVIQSGAGSRSLSRLDMEDLLKARALYSNIVAQERRNKDGEPLFKRHTFKFADP